MRRKPKEILHSFKQMGSAARAAETLGIHRSTVYRWVRRARTYRGYILERGIERKSTRPHHTRRVLTGEDRAAIAKIRRSKGYAAVKIKGMLKLGCHHSTVHRFLKQRGLVKPHRGHRRPSGQPTVHMHAKNTPTIGYLQMDVKYLTPQLTGLPWTCFEYAVIDIFSRYKEAVILNQLDQDGAMAALLEIMPKLPFKPVFIQTDNGLEFQGRFHELCEQFGLKHHYIHKRTPNENAVIERTFRTDEEEFFFRMPRAPQNYDELRSWFAQFLHEYNHKRLHLGIDLKTPAEVVANVVQH